MTSYNIGKNNPMYGKHHTEEAKQKSRLTKLGEKNPNWIGDKINCKAVHLWITRNYKKPELCEECKEQKAYDLANITGIYSRDIQNYRWLCRHCHMSMDGRLKLLQTYNDAKRKKYASK